MREAMAVVADRTALLLMDLQHAALASISEADGLLGRVGRLRRAALAAGVAVVHVRVQWPPPGSTGSSVSAGSTR